MQQVFFDLNDVAKRYRMSPAGIRGLVKRGELPPGVKIGGARRWSAEELDTWDRDRGYLPKTGPGTLFISTRGKMTK